MNILRKIYWAIRKSKTNNDAMSAIAKADTPEKRFQNFENYFKANRQAYYCNALGDTKHEFIETLINQVEQGALYKFDDRGLSWAAMNNVPELIEYFAEKGFNLEAYNKRAMRNAILYENYDVLKSLIENGAIVDDGLFKFTLKNQHYDIAKFFVEIGAHRPTKEYFYYFDNPYNVFKYEPQK